LQSGLSNPTIQSSNTLSIAYNEARLFFTKSQIPLRLIAKFYLQRRGEETVAPVDGHFHQELFLIYTFGQNNNLNKVKLDYKELGFTEVGYAERSAFSQMVKRKKVHLK
jgi:hypothetical protein